jgi:pimeloyl-ACP methyl ester carboxylesterase
MKTDVKNSFLQRSLKIALGIITLNGTLLNAQTPAAKMPDTTQRKPWYELGMMVDPILDQTLLFYLAMTWSGQADVGECLETASRVNTNDPDSWSIEWTKTADKLRLLAELAERQNHHISAGQIYLRAATYYTAALHRQNNPEDPIVKKNTQLAATYFIKAMHLLGEPVERVLIPYENTTLPGYYFRSPIARGPAPVIIVHQGRDGWAMHCKYIADAAVARGYNCLLIDGPGQGEVLRLQGLPFRYDWENVITPVVDYLITRQDVDTSRIGLMGLSMGGSLAPRAVAFEKRIKVCVANPGVLAWPEVVSDFLGQIDPRLSDLWLKNPEEFNAVIRGISAQVPVVDWGMRDMLWKHAAGTPAELMMKMQEYSVRPVVKNITCRMLVMDGAVDDFSQGKALFDALNCPKEYMFFGADDPALQHCQVGAQAWSSESLFDWIDGNL